MKAKIDKIQYNGQLDTFIQQLMSFNADGISDDQLARLASILSREECQPDRVARVSTVCSEICLWLRAVLDYANLRRQSNQQQN